MQPGTRSDGTRSFAPHAPTAHGASGRSLAGRVALVTGASAGIGAEFARFLAERGAHVALVARRADRLHSLAADLQRAHGVRTAVIVADMAEPRVSERIMVECRATLGAPDIVVNNAGYGPREGMVDAAWQDIADFLQVMVTSYVELSVRAAPHMRAQGYGRIIQVSSLASYAPEQRGSLYGPAKRFVTSFSKALALELAGTGVHACASCPGFTITEFHDVMGNRSHMEKLPRWMWSTSRHVVEATWNAADRGRPVVVVGALNRFIAFLCWLLPAWAVHAISPKSVAERRAPHAAGATRAAGAATRATLALALASTLSMVIAGGCGARSSATTGAGAASSGMQSSGAPSSSMQSLREDLPLIYLNLAASVGESQQGSDAAIAELGTLLPKVKADCEAGKAPDWTTTRTALVGIGKGLGPPLGMRSPTAAKNVGVLLPPSARIAWLMRAVPAPEARTTSAHAAYRIAPGGSVRMDLGTRTVELAVRAGTLAIEGYEDASPNERVSELADARLTLEATDGAQIDLALAVGSPSRAVYLKADQTGLLTAAFALRSTDPLLQQYFELFGTVRLTMDFVMRDGALDFAAAGPVPALLVAPSELPLEPGRDVCAGLPAPDYLAPAPQGQMPGFARPAGSAWTNAQLEVLKTYCQLRGDLQ